MTQRIVLVEYFVGERSTLIFGARADWEQPQVVEIVAQLDIWEAFAKTYFSLPDNHSQTGSTGQRVRQINLAEWEGLFAPLVEPLAQWSEPGDYVYLVPHKLLHYLPLHTLPVQGQPLIDRNPVAYVPSASILQHCHQRRRSSTLQNVLIFGDSDTLFALPKAREEALGLAALFKTQAFIGRDVTRNHVEQALQTQTYDAVHFACHGHFNPDQPLQSGLLLASEDASTSSTLMDLPPERFLTASDFFRIRLSVSLVTLSACNTGVNTVHPGDELFGLMRALIYAGTPSIVMSLWSVSDVSTELWMREFYQHLQRGRSKIEAVQMAQRTIRQMTTQDIVAYYDVHRQSLAMSDPRKRTATTQWQLWCQTRDELGETHQPFDHLYHWSPFILIGDWL